MKRINVMASISSSICLCTIIFRQIKVKVIVKVRGGRLQGRNKSMSHNRCIPLYNGAKTKPHTYLIKGVKVIRLSRDIYMLRG